jgi:CheY-like chemotaxis protein
MKEAKSILLVEDDDVDAKTVQRALEDLHVTNKVVRVTNGEEALARLRDPKAEMPGLILLDLSLPVMNGHEFMNIAKADERLRHIPIVVLTASRLREDKMASFKLSVAGYMVKPVDYSQFFEVVRTVNLYWTLSETP